MIIPFGEWRPDVAHLDNQFVSDIQNVLASGNSYIPCPGLAASSSGAMSGTPAGLTVVRASDGTYVVFGGSRTKLYKWSGTAWTDVTRLAGGDYNVASGDLWSFEQSGTKLVAVNINDVPQVIDIDVGTNFAALGGSPPQATHVKQCGDFLFLTGLSTNKRTLQWSAINDITGWTVGTNLSDTTEFPDGGEVFGSTGGQIGYAIQNRMIRTRQFLPGDVNTVHRFDPVSKDRGCVSKYGFTTVGDTLYFVAEDGYWALTGSELVPIGEKKVNTWFKNNSDPARRNLVQAFTVPDKPIVAWAFHSNSTTVTYDKLLLFFIDIGWWIPISLDAYVWAGAASAGVNLDTDTGETGDDLLDSDLPSLDSFAYVGGRPLSAAINPGKLLSFLNGNNLAATIETTEAHLVPGHRAFINEVYPLIDAPNLTVTAGTRERLQDTVSFGAAVTLEATGAAPLLSSSRLHRFRIAIPAGETWTHAQGIQVDAQPDGEA